MVNKPHMLPFLAPLLLVAALTPGVTASSGPRIKGVSATETEGTIGVHFTLESDLGSTKARQSLEQGVPLGVTYHIELTRSRPNWVDETVASTRIEVICSFNSATREYLMNYRRDRRLVRSEVLTEFSQLERALTVIDEKELFTTAGHRISRLRVRVKAGVGRGYFLSVLPTEISTNWKETRVRRAGGSK